MPHNHDSRLAPPHEKELRALFTLSDVPEPRNFDHLTTFVEDAPDPETAVRGVLNDMSLPSSVLEKKWRSVLTDLWAFYHPHVPLVPQLKLSDAELKNAPVLNDTHAALRALAVKPARLVQEDNEWFIEPDDVLRLARRLPSLKSAEIEAVENEWGCMNVRRLRAILHAARLVRPIKGVLTPVKSRVERFFALPRAQQFFILWHADVYHVDWLEFAGLWGKYMRLVQDYLPLVWETVNEGDIENGFVEDRARWAVGILETFMPLWDEEGLLDIRRGHSAALHIVQQHALPTIIDRFLLRDLFERHGLITITEEFGSLSKFTWTAIGEVLISAEAEQQLPCGNELLDNN